MRIAAVLGAAAVSTLAVAPAFGAAATSQATAQSLDIGIAGSDVITQQVTASNDGSGETKSNTSTLPNLAGVLPANNLIGAGVAPQDAFANDDGSSFACAGIAGTGSDGVVTVGNKACEIDSANLVSIDLANLDLGTVLLSDTSTLGTLINGLPGISDLLLTILGGLDGLLSQISTEVNGTPLGEITIGGSLSVIEAQCTANPTGAEGDTRFADTSGGNTVPIGLTLPQVGQITLLNLPVNPAPNTKLVTNPAALTAALIDGLEQELNTVIQGQLAPLAAQLGGLLDEIQAQVVEVLVDQLQPLLQPLEEYLLDITLNSQVSSEGGRKIDVTALDIQVVPAIEDSLVSGQIGHVTCGPNTLGDLPGGETGSPQNEDDPNEPGDLPDIPNLVNSGVAGNEDHTARYALGATAALMLLAGTAGLVGYRRMLTK